MLPDILDLLWL